MFKFTIPFYAFKLHFPNSGQVILPLSDKEAIRVGEPIYMVAGKYAELLQEKILNVGKARVLLDEYYQGDFLKDSVEVEFPASKDKFSFPTFSLEFDYFVNEHSEGVWGIVPILKIEAFATDRLQLEKRIVEAIKLEFARSKRLSIVQRIVSAIWFDFVELNQHEINLRALTPREIEKSKEEVDEALLPQVANHLRISKQIVYGRKKELELISRALKGKFARNVLLVGPSGVGKTALVWEIARQRSKKRTKGTIWETSASVMIKELMRETGWQDNLSRLCAELTGSDDILFIRNLMELFEVGKYEGNEVSMADYLRSFISRGEISVISECTEEEMARIDLASPNYLSMFQIIRLMEPEKQELDNIILKKVRDIASNHNVNIQEDAIHEVIRLNRRFTPYSGLPGKPIRFLESILLGNKKQKKTDQANIISRSEVIEYFCEDSGMPAFMVDPKIPMDIREIKADFNSKIYGQDKAVNGVVDLLSAVKTALVKTGKPIASFLFVGPTGVGKTELAKILAEFMFGRREQLIRFDMSEYSSPFSVMRLTGTNYFSDGILTSTIRKSPFCVLLFDEIEKAHLNFFDLLLQILSEGRLTDSAGKLVNFCSTIIIMTSNLGAASLMRGRISWDKSLDTETVSDHFMSEVQKHLRPELFNRIDQVIPFDPLDSLTVRFVVEREIELLRKREGIQFRRMNLDIDEKVLDYLAEKGYNSQYGARHLQRTIREKLTIPLARQLNLQDFDDQLIVKVFMEKERIKIDTEADPLGLELLIEELDKINQADQASAWRRSIHHLKESHGYIQLLSDIDILERNKKANKKKFWESQKKAEKYTRLLQTREKTNALRRTIESLEMDLSLACLGQKPYSPQITEEIKSWEQEFQSCKLELLSIVSPEYNNCHMGIYGLDPEKVIRFYLQLLRERSFIFTVFTVWFRESHYNEELSKTGEDGKRKGKREEYIKVQIDPTAADAFKPPAKGDILCGGELSVSGPACFLFLNEEEGPQCWKTTKPTGQNYIVNVQKKVFPTPTKIHRQEFYRRQNPRRVIDTDTLKDLVFKINREYRGNELMEIIEDNMENLFRIKIEQELF